MKLVNIRTTKKTLVGDSGTIWELPNYDGELFTASRTETPFLSAIGGLNGGLQTDNFEFPTSSLYTIPSRSQPAITETASVTVTPTTVSRGQQKNVTQIFQEGVIATYTKLSNAGRLSGINTAGASNNVEDELAWQQSVKLIKIAGDVNYSFHNGAYQIATDAGTANKTRGMFACINAYGTEVNAANTALTKLLLNSLLRAMYTAGARFNNAVIVVNAFQKQQLSSIFGFQPTDRNIGGVNVNTIITDFGTFGVMLDPDVPAAKLGVYELSVIAPVFQPVPNKGNLFYEALAKTGASETGQIYGQIGLDHGPGFMHGAILNLTTS